MKYLLTFILIFTAASSWAAEEKRSDVNLPAITVERFIGLQIALSKVHYPIVFDKLYEKLGGKQALVECCGRSGGRSGRVRTFRDYAVSKATSAGTYMIEFEFSERSEDRGKDRVIAARLCFMTFFGALLYADDINAHIGGQSGETKDEP